jgi:hypothetical protein
MVNPYTKETIREITLPPETMSSYAGEYTWIDPAQPAMIADKGTYLEAFLPGNARRTLVAYESDKFFAVGIELWFDFIRDSHGKVIRMEMNAGGNVVLFPKK